MIKTTFCDEKKNLFFRRHHSCMFSGPVKRVLQMKEKFLSKSHNSILNHYREMDGLECRLN